MKATKKVMRGAFKQLLHVARWALRKKYTSQEAREIERAFRDDPAELVCIAARDLQNELRKRRESGS